MESNCGAVPPNLTQRSSNDINLNFSEPWPMRHGMSPIILFIRIYTSRTFLTVFQERIAKHRTTLTSHPNRYTTEDLKDDGHLMECTTDASLDASLDHRRP
jgi:hypothetical protein